MGDKERREPRVLEWKAEEPLPPIVDANLSTFLLETMASYGSKTALVDAVSGCRRPYSYFCEGVPRVAGGLASAGVAEGEVLLLLSSAHVDFPLVVLAALHLGAVCLPVPPDVAAEELARVAALSGARWAVANGARAEAAVRGLLREGSLRRAWRLTHSLRLDSLTRLLSAKAVPPRRMGTEARATTAMIFMSSGTTGKPKGVMLSHTSLVMPHVCYRYMRSLTEGGEPTRIREAYSSLLIMLPLHHMFGFSLMMGCLASGGTGILLPEFTPRRFLQTIQEFKVTLCPLVPHIANFLKETPLLQEYDLSSLLGFSSSASPLSASTVRAVVEKTGKMFSSAYGMTEASVIAFNSPAHGFNPEAVGRVVPYVQVKVVDVESGRALAEGEEGEICVRGPTAMLGYANDPEATSDAVDAEGWLRTGDLGSYDDAGFLYVTDRLRDVVKVKGLQVSPREIEEVLLQAEGVGEAAVVGVPHPRTGEAPRAYVVPTPAARLSPARLREFVAGRVASHKQLLGGVEVVESLPRNPAGKVLKRKLRERYVVASKL